MITLRDRLNKSKQEKEQPRNAGISIDTAKVLTVSYSSLETLNSCPRKFELYKVHPMEMERDNSPALSLGSAVGVGYARY